ncbi:SDR family NAD(P)-dependent oxidoreductase [Aeromicrobium sp. CF4.19]|uniref:SDR family NAD(P)-dependent oxidoreductase n=1 Tax=Aeromicrobium sp. CF4.19 TaxID=3373082 RepID=UPI003EE4742E
MPRALITGGTAGLGLALAKDLAGDGWDVVVDGRDAERLAAALIEIGPRARGLRGDVTDADHRAALAALAGELDLVVNNASTLGASPLLPVLELDPDVLHRLWETNVVAAVDLVALVRERLRPGGAVISITSDAAAEHYPTWGGYAATKAALEHLTLTLAQEDPALSCWVVDPGDLRTAMHQAAFPGDDISDRPLPETVVPAFRRLLEERPPSGRHRAADLLTGIASEAVGA